MLKIANRIVFNFFSLSVFPHAPAPRSTRASSAASGSVWIDTWTFGTSCPAHTSVDCSNFKLEGVLEETNDLT